MQGRLVAIGSTQSHKSAIIRRSHHNIIYHRTLCRIGRWSWNQTASAGSLQQHRTLLSYHNQHDRTYSENRHCTIQRQYNQTQTPLPKQHRSYHSSITPNAPPFHRSTPPLYAPILNTNTKSDVNGAAESSSSNLLSDDAKHKNRILEEDILLFRNSNLVAEELAAFESLESQLQYIEEQLAETTSFPPLPSTPYHRPLPSLPKSSQPPPPPSPHPRPSLGQLLPDHNPTTPPPLSPSPTPTELLSYQRWLECQSQTEAAQKYEATLTSARSRSDHTSISVVKRHIISWYRDLRNRISKEQEGYLSGGGSEEKGTGERGGGREEGRRRRREGANKYGPFLCALQAEKLAVLTSHEALSCCLGKGGSVTLVSIANQIGGAVEAEVNVQRLLRERMRERRVGKKEGGVIGGEECGEGIEGAAGATDESLSSAELNGGVPSPKATQSLSNPNTIEWMYSPSHLQRFTEELNSNNTSRKARIRIKRANRRALKLLDSTEEWTTTQKVKLGAALLQMLLDTARVDLRGHGIPNAVANAEESEDGGGGSQRVLSTYGKPAFRHEKQWVNDRKLAGFVTLDEEFYKLVVEDKLNSLSVNNNRYKPMVVPPREWTGPKKGAFDVLEVDLMRTHGCQIQKDALQEADLSTIYDGLNVLGRVPWKINRTILETAQRCWDEDISIGDIPSQFDFEEPEVPIRPQMSEELQGNEVDKTSVAYLDSVERFRKYKEAMTKYRKIRQKNMDLRSLRCSALLKLNQAEQFKNFNEIYFPYNVDFRGRAYPIPPHLSNVGSDLCRGMLTFSRSKPLGQRGLYWLKVHLANLCGVDKISFDERAKFTEDNLDRVRAVTVNPMEANGGDGWWMEADDPFQALATCHEIIAAIDSGDPSTYQCSLPVHMDGSCNGLQHYAALGRDRVGGKAVNLCNFDVPQDVYIGVMEEVIERVRKEAEGTPSNAWCVNFAGDEEDMKKLSGKEKTALKHYRAAKLVNGLIDRGVVKRTVMTSVYGVTYIGARMQIQEKIEEKLEAKGYDVDEMDNEIYSACGYLASVTMDVMGELFSGARQTMNWLATCARLIASQGQPVAWISPIGIPAVQPYRQPQPYTIVTLLQSVVLINNSDNLPVHRMRQASAFPPNYVHSLDSSHMLLTALEMDRRGLEFSAVHDSFWTHPCDVDEMNDVLRDCFIDLYERPLLEELKETWELRYPSLDFPDLPAKGNLCLKEVKDAPYFFQ